MRTAIWITSMELLKRAAPAELEEFEDSEEE